MVTSLPPFNWEDDMEKTPLQSKKYVAFLIGEITWKVLVALSILYGCSIITTLSIVAVAGFLEIVYIGKQADLDRYIRLAEIASHTKENLEKDPD